MKPGMSMPTGQPGHAARLLAAQAAIGLVQRAIQIEPERDLIEVVDALLGRLVRHGGALRRDGA